MLRKIPFIDPSVPVLSKIPPTGRDWTHEVKFDGFRAQVHLERGVVTIYSRKGNDLTRRCRSLLSSVASLRTTSAIIDCELVACDESGLPDFKALMRGKADAGLRLWAFDLLALNGEKLLDKTLTERRSRLRRLINTAADRRLQFSGSFSDPVKLLAAAERLGLEGVVSKRRGSTYQSGRTGDWLKIKTAAWRGANRDRFEMLHKL